MTSPPPRVPLPRFAPRDQLGLKLPPLTCWHCHNDLVMGICWDADVNRLCCIRCAAVLHRLDHDRFVTLTFDVRERVPGMRFMPAGQAIALLITFGAELIDDDA